MTLKDKAAKALDESLDDASNNRGIYTDKARTALAAWLDGQIKLKASTVRVFCNYLTSL